MRAIVVLTPSESKRLIAKAVASMEEVEKALRRGTVVIIKGTTNSYVAEEILGKKIARERYARGVVVPGSLTMIPPKEQIPDIIIEKGVVRENLALTEALDHLKGGDVVIKGGNALDPTGVAGIYLGDPGAGTIGLYLGPAMARGLHLIIPVGLEKLIPSRINDFANELGIERVDLSMGMKMGIMPVMGTVVTEIQAFRTLSKVEAVNIGAGGVGGAEGSRTFLLKGDDEAVQKAYDLVQTIREEPGYKPVSVSEF